MSALIKIMNDEIKKYQGRIYYLDMRKDVYGYNLKPRIDSAYWITNTQCYDHYSFELHHMIRFTHYEQNTNWYKERGLKNCLVLIPKVMHQHLENPVYGLDEETFYKKYKIHKYDLLFIKDEYYKGNYPEVLSKSFENEIEYDGCFDSLYEKEGVC